MRETVFCVTYGPFFSNLRAKKKTQAVLNTFMDKLAGGEKPIACRMGDVQVLKSVVALLRDWLLYD